MGGLGSERNRARCINIDCTYDIMDTSFLVKRRLERNLHKPRPSAVDQDV
jgi:hypothetical protein